MRSIRKEKNHHYCYTHHCQYPLHSPLSLFYFLLFNSLLLFVILLFYFSTPSFPIPSFSCPVSCFPILSFYSCLFPFSPFLPSFLCFPMLSHSPFPSSGPEATLHSDCRPSRLYFNSLQERTLPLQFNFLIGRAFSPISFFP